MQGEKGFTLVEVLTTLGILAIITVAAINVFFSLVKGAAKARVIESVKQEGDYALSVMERTIRNARRVINCGAEAVTIENPDLGETTFHFCGGSESLIAAESGDLTCAEARLTSENVRLDSGAFTCAPPANEFEPYVIGVSFTLGEAKATPRIEEKASVDFRTTIILRTLP